MGPSKRRKKLEDVPEEETRLNYLGYKRRGKSTLKWAALNRPSPTDDAPDDDPFNKTLPKNNHVSVVSLDQLKTKRDLKQFELQTLSEEVFLGTVARRRGEENFGPDWTYKMGLFGMLTHT